MSDNEQPRSLLTIIRQYFQPYYRPRPKQSIVKTDKVKTDKVKTDKSKTDKVKTDKSKTNKVKTDKSKTDKSKTDKVKTDKVKTDKVKTDKVKTDKVKTDKVKTDKVKTSSTGKSSVSRTEDFIDEDIRGISIDELLKDDKILMHVINKVKPLNELVKLNTFPEPDTIWYYHDATKHQILAQLMPSTGFRAKNRDDIDRGDMTPLIYPIKTRKPFDRTHLIPFGYHNSESDNRLIIGWDSNANRNELNAFEKSHKHHNFPIYWFVDIRKTPNGAVWKYEVYDARNNKLIARLINRMGTESKSVRFKWVRTDPRYKIIKE